MPLAPDVIKKCIARFQFPEMTDSGLRVVIGYGSQVFKQASELKSSLVDLLVVVDDDKLAAWHTTNMKTNGSDYSLLCRLLPKRLLIKLQNSAGGVLFCPDVQLNKGSDIRIKYGVISYNTLLSDLRTWDHGMYLAGRLQKLVDLLYVHDDIKADLDATIAANRRSACCTSLIERPATMTDHDCLMDVMGLSYLGDPRMKFAENPKKVENIVTAQIDSLRGIYHPILRDLGVSVTQTDSGFDLDQSELSLDTAWQNCPPLQSRIGLSSLMEKDVEGRRQAVCDIVSGVVGPAAGRQTLKGAVTSPVFRMLPYIWAKIQKGRAGVREDKKE